MRKTKLILPLTFAILLESAWAFAAPGRPAPYPGDDRRGGGRDGGIVRPDDGRRGRDDRYVPPHRPPSRPPARPPHRPPTRPPVRPPHNPPPPHYPTPPPNRYGEARVNFYDVTRRSGGEWLRINIHRPMSIRFVEARVRSAALQIHEAIAVTNYGSRIRIYRLERTGTLYAGQRVMSESLNYGERIVAIDLRAESMGGYSTVEITVESDEGTPILSTRRY